MARIAHMIMLFTAHTGKMVIPTVTDVVAAYSAVSGYDPSQTQPDGSNPTDAGCETPDVLNYWRDTGIGGHKIVSWQTVNQANLAEVKQGLYLFGGVAIDIAIYQSMMDQTNANQPWDNPSGDLLGYHAVPIFGYGSEGNTCVTWGALQQMGWPTFSQVCQGAYVVRTPDWVPPHGYKG